MKRVIYLLVGSLVILSLLAAAALAEGEEKAEAKTVKKEEVKHDFVGAKKCKICHKDVYTSWETTVHAKAWESLKPEEQKNKDCAGCHSTGTTEKGELLTGVQCEACHGAGSDYKKMSVMKDQAKAIAAGLVMPDSTTCITCHNEKSPNFKGFNFTTYVKNAKGIHAMPVKEEKAEKKEG